MKLQATLVLLLASSVVDGARMRGHIAEGAARLNETSGKAPYILDRCTEVKEVYGSADYMGKDAMSLEVCFNFCSTRNAFYFGVRNGKDCWCGHQYQARVGSATLCDVPCTGDEEVMCGGKYATSVYIMGKGPCDDGPKGDAAASKDKDLGQANDALNKATEQAEKIVAKKNKKIEVKAVQKIDEAKHLVAQAKQDAKNGDQAAAKEKLAEADSKAKEAKKHFDKMKAVGDGEGTREKQAEDDLKAVKKVLKEVKADPTPEKIKEAEKTIDQAAAKPPPKRAPVCLNLNRAPKSFEYMGLHGRFARHQGFRLKVADKSDDDLFKNDATFEVMPGNLASAQCGVSLRSKNYPERYLRHRNFELHLDPKPKDNDDLFNKDSTFEVVNANDAALSAAYLLRSVNFPDRYIHVRGNLEAYLDQLASGGAEKEFSFKVTAPLMSALGSRVVKSGDGGDWTNVKCDDGAKLIGGGCDSKEGPHVMQYSAPNDETTWRCGGHGPKKKVWAICAKGLDRTIVKKSGGDWTTAECPAGQKVISGGCDAYDKPFIMQYNGPDGESKWKCGGHGGPKHVWAICSADAGVTIKHVDGGDWTTVECDGGKKMVGGGCNAKDGPHRFQMNAPEGEKAWKCGGHGGPKSVWVICEA